VLNKSPVPLRACAACVTSGKGGGDATDAAAALVAAAQSGLAGRSEVLCGRGQGDAAVAAPGCDSWNDSWRQLCTARVVDDSWRQLCTASGDRCRTQGLNTETGAPLRPW